MNIKLQTEHHLECLTLQEGCPGPAEFKLVKYHVVGKHMSWLISSKDYLQVENYFMYVAFNIKYHIAKKSVSIKR